MILSENRDSLFSCIDASQQFLRDNLNLELHPNKIILRKLSWGIDFCGYIALPYYILPRLKTKRRMFKKVAEKRNSLNFYQTLASYLGYLSHANTYKLRKQLYAKLGLDQLVTIVYTLYTMQTVIHVKADLKIKRNAQKLAKELGISLSDIINASLRNFLKTRQITFSSDERMTPELEKYLDKVEDDIKHNRNIVGPFKTTAEMDRYLDSP